MSTTDNHSSSLSRRAIPRFRTPCARQADRRHASSPLNAGPRRARVRPRPCAIRSSGSPYARCEPGVTFRVFSAPFRISFPARRCQRSCSCCASRLRRHAPSRTRCRLSPLACRAHVVCSPPRITLPAHAPFSMLRLPPLCIRFPPATPSPSSLCRSPAAGSPSIPVPRCPSRSPIPPPYSPQACACTRRS
jgi:hypothetical protein